MNSRGPITEPCGTSEVTTTGSDKAPSTLNTLLSAFEEGLKPLYEFPSNVQFAKLCKEDVVVYLVKCFRKI